MGKISRSLKIFVILSLSLLVGLNGCDLLPAKPTATPQVITPSNQDTIPMAEGRLVPRNSTWLTFFSSARVAEVLVEEGQHVVAGTILARLGDREQIEAQLKAAEQAVLEAQEAVEQLEENAEFDRARIWSGLLTAQATLMTAQEGLERLDTSAYQDRIERAWEKILDEKERVEQAQTEFDKYKNLDEDNYSRRYAENRLEEAQDRYDQAVRSHARLVNALDQARASVAQAQASVNDAQKRYDDCQDGPNPDTLAIYKARLTNAQAQRLAALAALNNMNLVAPYSGEITSIKISAGEPVVAGAPVIQIADFSEWYVETTDLNQLEVVDINPGQKVIIQPDALPGVELIGSVVHIATAYVEKSGDILYTVRIRLEKVDERLRWGMTFVLVFGG